MLAMVGGSGAHDDVVAKANCLRAKSKVKPVFHCPRVYLQSRAGPSFHVPERMHEG